MPSNDITEGLELAAAALSHHGMGMGAGAGQAGAGAGQAGAGRRKAAQCKGLQGEVRKTQANASSETRTFTKHGPRREGPLAAGRSPDRFEASAYIDHERRAI